MSNSKRSIDDLAVFGGPPAFPSSRVSRRRPPDVSAEFIRLVKQAYDSRRLSNDGPMVRELEKRLAELHGVKHCIAVANVGLALMMLIQTLAGGRSGEVIMPAFSFGQHAHLARWAGQHPRFCDVDQEHHMVTAELVARQITQNTTIILATCGLCGGGDLAALELLAERHCVPLVLESSFGIGMQFRGKPLGCNGSAEVFGLKALHQQDGFDGAYVTTLDDRLAATLRQQRNFCFPTESVFPPSGFPWVVGLNAKLNEVHASLALALLNDHNELSVLVRRSCSHSDEYASVFDGLPGVARPCSTKDGNGAGEVILRIVEVSPDWFLSRDETVTILRREGYCVAPYFSAPFDCSVARPWEPKQSDLRISQTLSERYMQLPLGETMDNEDVSTLRCILQLVAKHRCEIAARLRHTRTSL